jgi:anaerobic selenocysteine-containing dehydrogenase
MHNVPTMMGGSNRCTLLMHPQDAMHLGFTDGAVAHVRSRVGEVSVPVAVSDEVMPGVVSLPHGWGHDLPGVRLSVAGADAGVSANDLTEGVVDPLSGNAVLNCVPVTVEPVAPSHEPVGTSRLGSGDLAGHPTARRA